VEICGKPARALLDSGAQTNVISHTFVKENRIPWRMKEEPYELKTLERKNVSYADGNIDKETEPGILKIGEHQEMITLDLAATGQFEILLGIPWLRMHNPLIDWRNNRMEMPPSEGPKGTHAWRKTPERNIKIKEISQRGIERARRKGQAIGQYWYRPEERSTVRNIATTEAEKKTVIPAAYEEFREIFTEKIDDALPAHQSWDHEIPLEPGKQPKFGPIYSLSRDELQVLDEHLKKNLKKGYIRPSESPAGYPVMFVKKKDGTLRLCVDFRQLNSITIKNRYPLPLISELKDRLHKAKYFTKLDLREGYHLVRIKEGEEWKTAFRTRYGHYEYTVMPFGLTNAPATFQALVNSVLREYLDHFVVAYLDDILIYSETLEEHEEHVKKVLRKLAEHQLACKPEKCEFSVQRTGFLGCVISPGRIEMEDGKVTSILEWPEPKNVKELQSFLGLANYYRQFIEGYSKIAEPLTGLTRKNLIYEWTRKARDAFQKLKEKFSTKPVLAIFDPEKEITLETDASDKAMGAILNQPDEKGKNHPIAFYSRKLRPEELNYDVHDKELLAIVEAFTAWRVYLEGAKYPVQVYTDHKNLTYFTTTKELNRRQIRWSEKLGSYNFKITYRKGTENARADALSRRPDYMDGDKPKYPAMLRTDKTGNIEFNHVEIAATYRVDKDDEWTNKIRQAQRVDLWCRRARNLWTGDIDTPSCKCLMIKTNAGDPKDYYWHCPAHPDNEDNPSNKNTHVKEELAQFNGLIYIPTKLRHELVKEFHSTPMHGHQGIGKTLERLTRSYYFPGMRKIVEKVIAECECAKNKSNRHAPYGLMKSPKTPERAWESIAWDFIVKLPVSTEPMTGTKYDAILVIVDRLTKYAYFIPYKEASTAEDLAYAFLRTVVSQHGLPKEIISDRDKLFISKFWQTLTTQLGTKSKLSTAFHPQTDGQTERTNQTLEQYLRCYVNYRQDNWVGLLPMAQFAYNSASTETTKVSPFFANYGFEPEAYRTPRTSEYAAQRAILSVENIKELHKQLSMDIQFLALRSARYYDKHRSVAPTFKRGDKVYLLRKNIKTKRPSSKLDHVKIGPFKIKRIVSSVNYELELPEKMKIHPIFHVMLLEPAPANARTDTKMETNNDDEYEVEKILDTKLEGQTIKYLVKWKDYPNSENTWEPERHLKKCYWMVKQFHRQNPDLHQRTARALPSTTRDQEDPQQKKKRPQRAAGLPSRYVHALSAHPLHDPPPPSPLEWRNHAATSPHAAFPEVCVVSEDEDAWHRLRCAQRRPHPPPAPGERPAYPVCGLHEGQQEVNPGETNPRATGSIPKTSQGTPALTHSPHRVFPSNTLHREGSRGRQREQARGMRIPKRAVRSESRTRCSVALDFGTLGMVKEEEGNDDGHLRGRDIAGYLSEGTPPRINLRAEGLGGEASVTNTVTEVDKVLAFEECSKQVRLITAIHATGPRGVRLGRVGILDSPTETAHWWKDT
jgi:hypothetical protein